MTDIYKKTVNCLLIISCLSLATGTPVTHCMDMTPIPDSVEIKNCEKPPCLLYIGTNNIMKMTFRAPRYLEYFAPQAKAFALGINLNYPLNQTDGCESVINTPCPLAAGEMVEYEFQIFVSNLFPELQAEYEFEFSLVDKERNGEPFECFVLGIQLKRDSPGVMPQPIKSIKIPVSV